MIRSSISGKFVAYAGKAVGLCSPSDPRKMRAL
jgi:hypothetical protein